jgi:CheY-like chemotaxis protein
MRSALEEEVERRRRIEAELQAKVKQLADADRQKDEFLAMLGHELRNPLSAVRNAIATASLDGSRRERALDIARRQSDQLGRLIDDLLDVGRITQGRITLQKSRVSLARIIEGAVDGTRPFIEDRRQQVTVSLPEEDIRLEADPVRLEQVIVNLLTNAATYTEPGGRVDVLAGREGGEAVLRVRDTGMGIAPELLSSVFELFAQATRALDRSEGGLGVGLTIARRLVELHRGSIEARSDGLGKGSEFVVRLPALPASHDERGPTPRSEPRQEGPARVLMLEDNPDAAESLKMLLELLGHHVRDTREGHAALAAARANLPDVVLVDIGLPGMDGYEFARRVRQDPALKHLVLVALTGYGCCEDKEQAMAAGFDYHIVKPVDVDVLRTLVARLGKADSAKPPTLQ